MRVCTHVYAYVHAYMCVSMCVCVCMHICVCVSVCVCVCVCVCIHTFVYMCVYVQLSAPLLLLLTPPPPPPPPPPNPPHPLCTNIYTSINFHKQMCTGVATQIHHDSGGAGGSICMIYMTASFKYNHDTYIIGSDGSSTFTCYCPPSSSLPSQSSVGYCPGEIFACVTVKPPCR